MSRLDDYRTALFVAHPHIPTDVLEAVLDERGESFATFVIDYGLGPMWHERTGRDEFHVSRMQAEALYLAQERVLQEIGTVLVDSNIAHVIVKGGANRLVLYDNPALRACHDLDILVGVSDKVRAAKAIASLGFIAAPEPRSISRELVMTRGDVVVDLHWGLIREGRLRHDPTEALLKRRRRVQDIWIPSPEDTLFALLVHPAFAKHLAGWTMGLHRVADLLTWTRSQSADWEKVAQMLEDNGVRTAAWATLRWAQLLAGEHAPDSLHEALFELQPRAIRRRWIDVWLRNDLPARLSTWHRARLLGFSMFLHDTAGDALRAASGRRQAARRSKEDLAAFNGLLSK